jgi:hypothetical protein
LLGSKPTELASKEPSVSKKHGRIPRAA